MQKFVLFVIVLSSIFMTSCSTAENSVSESSAGTAAEYETDNKIDFGICPNPDSGYIITDNANSLTLEKLYPLIFKARHYMVSSNDCCLDDAGQWQVIRIGYPDNPITYEDFVAETSQEYKQVFTDRLVDNIPKPNDENYESGMYVYSIGFLSGSANEGYIYGNDRGTDATYCDSDWQIEVVSDTEVRLIHQAFYSIYPEWTEGDEPVYFKDHMLLNQADDSVHELRTYENRSERLETYYYTILWEDEHWKFDSFSLWT